MNFFKSAASFVEKAAEAVEDAVEDVVDDAKVAAKAAQKKAAELKREHGKNIDMVKNMAKQASGHLTSDNTKRAGPVDSASGAKPANGTFAQQSAEAIPALVRMFSGCRDSQTSADVSNVSSFSLPADAGPGGAGGACTNALMSVLLNNAHPNITWLELLKTMREVLDTKGYSQVPELSTSRQMNLDDKFSIINKQPEAAAGGRKKSLLIGINYVGQQGELRGCHNDVLTLKKYITSQGFPDDAGSMRILMDDGVHEQPTFKNIVDAFAWLTAGAQPGDSLFCSYSGHGASVADDNGDESDKKDETLVPLDFQTAGMIRDDMILAELVVPLPKGSQLTVIMDCCHSGTILDLPYIFIADTSNLESINSEAAHHMQENPGFDFTQLLKIGKLLLSMHQKGATGAQLAKTAAMELYKAGALEAVGGVSGAMQLMGSLASATGQMKLDNAPKK